MTTIPGTQTAGRALRLLRAVAESDSPPLLGDLAQLVGINRPAAYRLARELEEQGLVEVQVHGDERRYVPGAALIGMAARVLGRINIRATAQPFLVRISDATGETIALHLRDRRHWVCISGVEGRHPIRWVVPLGERWPLHTGPTGKAILASLPDSERAAILAWAADQGQPVATYLLDTVRARGYFAAVGDQTPGVGGLSVPLFDASGVVGALTVSGPGDRWNQQAMEAAAPLVVEQCAALSVALGHGAAPLVTQSPANGSAPDLSGVKTRVRARRRR